MKKYIVWCLMPDKKFDANIFFMHIKKGEIGEARLSSDGYIYIATDVDKEIDKCVSFVSIDIDDALSEYFYKMRILTDISKVILKCRDKIVEYGDKFFDKYNLKVKDFVVLYE